MGISYLRFLLDSDGLAGKVRPIVGELEGGNLQPLREAALRAVSSDPTVSEVLDTLQLGPGYSEDEFPSTPKAWITMVAAQFLEPIVWPGPGDDWIYLKAVLPHLGWSDTDVLDVVFGRTLCGLLIEPDKELDEGLGGREELARDWCEAYIGFVPRDHVAALASKLEGCNSELGDFLRRPTAFSMLRAYLGLTPAQASNLTSDLAAERITGSFASQVRTLKACLDSNRAFAAAVV